VKHEASNGLGFNFLMMTLHYNQLDPSPWNGFAALAEAYTAFDEDDQRREIFLVGPQVNLDTGDPVTDRSGNPLVFTVDIIDETNAGEGEGPRIIKWPPDPNHVSQHHGNDFAYFRLGGIMLIKAEASFEMRERLFEVTYEAKRRQDLIRHGRFTQAWSFKQQGAPHLVLMPIPQPQLDANPLLVQNPGY
jgi:hypothetical protein